MRELRSKAFSDLGVRGRKGESGDIDMRSTQGDWTPEC